MMVYYTTDGGLGQLLHDLIRNGVNRARLPPSQPLGKTERKQTRVQTGVAYRL